ncbi:FHA domain-containing protein [Kineobactrum salinum]|uniref:FHA domain-containing protein n=1 Tax=Kineobactrum salinum TaxID=2708301 RepID=A0A6C0U2I6_9GAMM|nr:FHA domain-containing protein [Kineobactrum salinum]QIB66138.1 FHA domain-containing protein [Kineobactrum salinum]
MSEKFSVVLVAQDGTEQALSGEMRVGRSAECDVTIEDPRVSRNHALVRVEEPQVVLEDLGSANGTLVNGLKLVGSVELADGDEVQFDKYKFRVVITGAPPPAADSDATIVAPVGDDATVVSPMEPPPAAVAEPAAKPVDPVAPPAAAAEAAPPAAAKPAATEPPAATEKPAPEAKAPPAEQPAAVAKPASSNFDLPGSWVDSGTGEHTQFLSIDSVPEAAPAPTPVGRSSDLPHLMVVIGGEVADVMELEPGNGSEPDVWEIGREDSCEIMLQEPSVSARHAQLIHQGGRWRLVNLVSANGIFVNGEKRLTAYLADGDQIRLGLVNLIFRASANAPAAGAAPRPGTGAASGTARTGSGSGFGSSPRNIALAGAAAVLVALVALAWFLL